MKQKNTNKASWVDSLQAEELGRWAALVEGVNLVADVGEEKKIPINKISFKIPALQHYVQSTCDSMTMKFNMQRMGEKS